MQIAKNNVWTKLKRLSWLQVHRISFLSHPVFTAFLCVYCRLQYRNSVSNHYVYRYYQTFSLHLL